MAKKKSKNSAEQPLSRSAKIRNAFKDKSFQAAIGLFLISFSLILFTSFISYFISWKTDFSNLTLSSSDWLSHPAIEADNFLGKLGAYLAHLFIYKWFGVSAFLWAFYFLNLGVKIALNSNLLKPSTVFKNNLVLTLLISLLFGSLTSESFSLLSGGLGYFTNLWLHSLFGGFGIAVIWISTLLIYLTITFQWTPETFRKWFDRIKSKSSVSTDKVSEVKKEFEEEVMAESEIELQVSLDDEPEYTSKDEPEAIEDEMPLEINEIVEETGEESTVSEKPKEEAATEEDDVDFEIETIEEDDALKSSEIKKSAKDFGDYDPKLDLSRFKLPPLDLLKDYGNSNITINQEELEANKSKIKETLNNYNIGIDKITATIGPTITLYEIVPSAGVRISKIKNLEDDIALSLSALGIRIIAPIPGRGTIGIEVPNADPKTVSMKTVLASEKFQKSDMELPIAMGKTISNQTFCFDLAKMPHLLMAGATGQGKSVGLNAILTSLLYKKHPSQVKFILVDPKKVELTLFNKIERHYLAKLPDTEEAIITDTTKVIHTLNSLCIEMDNRYDLLKDAMCRNIKEYNTKFIARKLNPNDGHKYLPYIVLVIDEFADLIMTAGKEVETPIARLAQLARAIGIHLIVATQRPSVNVITGIIKANFPARIAFRVTSKIDSRTILDAGGADQLIGRGDMLMSQGSDLTRIQCAFVDTPEVEEITDFIGNQQAYPEAYQLPEYVGEDGGGNSEGIDISERDALFNDAARVVVIHQQGSASLLQRKLKLGYNRAGRIVDQLEAAGIIGPFEGSKARQVLIPDEVTLDRLLENESLN